MEIYTLTGPSGTGKSYRAMDICKQYNIDGVIDDGLFIYKGMVTAGESAKRCETKIGAVKAAIFKDERLTEMFADIRDRLSARARHLTRHPVCVNYGIALAAEVICDFRFAGSNTACDCYVDHYCLLFKFIPGIPCMYVADEFYRKVRGAHHAFFEYLSDLRHFAFRTFYDEFIVYLKYEL